MTQPEIPPDCDWIEFDEPFSDRLLWTITGALFGVLAVFAIVAIYAI